MRQFFTDGSGALSSARFVMVAWSLGLLLMWIIICIIRRELADIPPGVLVAHGTLISGKILQAFSPGDQAPKNANNA